MLSGFCRYIDASGIFPGSVDTETVEGAISLTRFFMRQVVDTLQLYDLNQSKALSGYQKRSIEALRRLQSEVKNGKLALTRITQIFNEGLPRSASVTEETVKAILTELGLQARRSTGGRSYLFWDSQTVESLFSLPTATSAPAATNAPINPAMDVEATEMKWGRVSFDPVTFVDDAQDEPSVANEKQQGAI